MSGITPVGDKVLVKEHGAATNYDKTSIVVPSGWEKPPYRGTVVLVGAGMPTTAGDRVPLDLRPGDVVLFERYSGLEVEIEGAKHRLIPYSELLASIEDPALVHETRIMNARD